MIDPKNITNFNPTDAELEETICFWVLAAGKNGVTAARLLETLLNKLCGKYGEHNPFSLIRCLTLSELKVEMKSVGIGCWNLKATSFVQLANSNLNLRTCTVDDLEKIKGIGCKTSRCFLIHSRPGMRLAGLDVHILHFLRDSGFDVPKSTPTGKKYKQIEQWFISEADKVGKSIAEFDLELWNKYRK